MCKSSDINDIRETDHTVVDAEGAYVGPGVVDIHVHEGGHVSTSFDPTEAAEYFLKHGETSIVASPYYEYDFDK